MQKKLWLIAVLFLVAGCNSSSGSLFGGIDEFTLAWPNAAEVPPERRGSTHELTYEPGRRGASFWITGTNYDYVAELAQNGAVRYHRLPEGSVPHGIEFDGMGRLWVSLEGLGEIVQLNSEGEIVEVVDLGTICEECVERVDPHGLAIGSDGQTIWYTGKETDLIGKISPDGTVTNFLLPTSGSLPIYIQSGPDGNMWFTELTGNRIGRITPDGVITQFNIPTPNSRPIAIVRDPGGQAMWFSQEAGNNVARIDMNGVITEFPVPKTQENVILAGLAFDNEGNLWTQQYVDANNPDPSGPDHVIRIDRAILSADPAAVGEVEFTYFEVPTARTVMHRIVQGPDGNMWFTQLKTDKVGRLFTDLGPL